MVSLTKRLGHRLFICCLPDLPAEFAISERAARLSNAKTDKTADDPRSKIVMCYVTCLRYPIWFCYFLNTDMTAHTQSEKI